MERRAFLCLLGAAPGVLLLAENTAPPALPALALRKDAFSSMRLIQAYTVTRVEVSRYDILFGMATIDPPFMCGVKPLGARARRRQKRERQASVLKTRPDGMVETYGWTVGAEVPLKAGDVVTFSFPSRRLEDRVHRMFDGEDDDCGDDDEYDD